MDITNSDDLREKIHEIHNYMRNNGIGYGLTSLKVFNLFYGLMKIEEYGLNEAIGLNNEKCKFSYLLKLVNDPNKNDDLISTLYNETLDSIYENENIKVLLGYNIPLDLKTGVYKYLINEINLIKDIEKSTKEQLSGKIYEYFVGRDQSAISELGAYFTNRGIVDFILNKIKPQLKPDGTIPKMIDMFGGSGGFTIGYMDYLIKNKFKIDWKSQLDNIYHFDINEDVLKSARLELFCLSQGIFSNINNVKRINSFKEDFRDIGKFDIIMTNPPYGGDKIGTSVKKEKRDKIIKYINNEIDIFKINIIERIEKIDIKNKKKILEDIKKPKTDIDKIVLLIKDIDIFDNDNDNDKNIIKRIQELYNQQYDLKKENKTEIENNKKLCVNVDSCSDEIKKFAKENKIKGTDKEACSLMLIMDLLALNGTAVGVIKEGLFFDSSYMELRKVLLKNYNVKEIISVPQNQFENTSTKTSIIIFNNDGDIKTSYINFSELNVNLYEKDEFIEIIQNDKIEIKLKYNKGDIINIEEVFIKTVSIDDILKNDNYSLNSKDYNKVSIIPGESFELVCLGDICKFQAKSKRQASFGKDNGIYNFYTSSDKIKKCDEADYNDECLIIGTGGVANIKIDKKFSCSSDNIILSNINIKYLYYLLSGNIYLLENGFNGSTIKHLSKKYLEELEIPIPKSPELLEYWENKISQPFMKKQEKERRFNEVEEEIKNKIKDIQENHEWEQVKLGDIINYINGKKRNTTDGLKCGLYPLFSSSLNIDYYINEYDYNNKSLIINTINGSGKFNIHYSNKFCATSNTIIFTTKNIKFINYLYYYIIINIKFINELATGSTKKKMDKNKISNFKIQMPKDTSLIDNLQPLFNEVEELQKEIKELKEIYNNYLTELSKEAIKNQEILNSNSNNNDENQEEPKEEHQEEEIQEEETISIKSNKSQTIEQLKEQCKALGIKGYSKKKKDELIELIKNHK
jgi:type I restriction-modification system DNA methylase subunit